MQVRTVSLAIAFAGIVPSGPRAAVDGAFPVRYPANLTLGETLTGVVPTFVAMKLISTLAGASLTGTPFSFASVSAGELASLGRPWREGSRERQRFRCSQLLRSRRSGRRKDAVEMCQVRMFAGVTHT